jgi:hypothetical protein
MWKSYLALCVKQNFLSAPANGLVEDISTQAGAVSCDSLFGQRSELEFGSSKARRGGLQSGRGNQLGITTPGVMPRVHPALQVLKLEAFDGVDFHNTLRLGLSLGQIHRGKSDSPQEQAQGDSQHHGQYRPVTDGIAVACFQDILPENGSLELRKVLLCFLPTSLDLLFSSANWRRARRWLGRTLLAEVSSAVVLVAILLMVSPPVSRPEPPRGV